MMPWVRDDGFLEGSYRNLQKERYIDFLKRNRDKNILLLELGVGDMTPSIIKMPFWQLTAECENVFFISVNTAKSAPPAHIGKRAAAISDDLGHFLSELTKGQYNG